MSKYDNITLEQELKNSVTRKAHKAARVGLDFVARGGDLDEARAKVKKAASVSDSAEDHVVQAAAVIETEALAHFEVNLDEAEAKAVVHLEKVAAEEAAQEEEREVEAKAKTLIEEIANFASDIQWPAIYVDNMDSLYEVEVRIDALRGLGVCGRPWKDCMSPTSFRFTLQSISKKYRS